MGPQRKCWAGPGANATGHWDDVVSPGSATRVSDRWQQRLKWLAPLGLRAPFCRMGLASPWQGCCEHQQQRCPQPGFVNCKVLATGVFLLVFRQTRPLHMPKLLPRAPFPWLPQMPRTQTPSSKKPGLIPSPQSYVLPLSSEHRILSPLSITTEGSDHSPSSPVPILQMAYGDPREVSHSLVKLCPDLACARTHTCVHTHTHTETA